MSWSISQLGGVTDDRHQHQRQCNEHVPARARSEKTAEEGSVIMIWEALSVGAGCQKSKKLNQLYGALRQY